MRPLPVLLTANSTSQCKETYFTPYIGWAFSVLNFVSEYDRFALWDDDLTGRVEISIRQGKEIRMFDYHYPPPNQLRVNIFQDAKSSSKLQ